MKDQEIEDLLMYVICSAIGHDPEEMFCGSMRYEAWDEGFTEFEDFRARAKELRKKWDEMRKTH